jgi:clan AA aspartic protease
MRRIDCLLAGRTLRSGLSGLDTQRSTASAGGLGRRRDHRHGHCRSRGSDHGLPPGSIIDTGFSGFLTLPTALINALGLRIRGRAQVTLADSSMVLTNVYTGAVIWDGQPRVIEIDAADIDPLVGMSLLRGFELRIQVIDGGSVTVQPLP